jgi:3-oxoacyl-[acyl-carrier protein] reductase
VTARPAQHDMQLFWLTVLGAIRFAAATGDQAGWNDLRFPGHEGGGAGDPGEVAAATARLARPGASYITGQCVVVDGGNSIAEQRTTPA